MEIQFKSEASRERWEKFALIFQMLLIWFSGMSLLVALPTVILHVYQAAHYDEFKVIELTLDGRYLRGGGGRRGGNRYFMLEGTNDRIRLSIRSTYVPELEQVTNVHGLPLKVRFSPDAPKTAMQGQPMNVAPYGVTPWGHVRQAATALIPAGAFALLLLTVRRLNIQPEWLVRPTLWERQTTKWPLVSPPPPPRRKRSMTARARLRRRFRR
jgi:hypothetical protein